MLGARAKANYHIGSEPHRRGIMGPVDEKMFKRNGLAGHRRDGERDNG